MVAASCLSCISFRRYRNVILMYFWGDDMRSWFDDRRSPKRIYKIKCMVKTQTNERRKEWTLKCHSIADERMIKWRKRVGFNWSFISTLAISSFLFTLVLLQTPSSHPIHTHLLIHLIVFATPNHAPFLLLIWFVIRIDIYFLYLTPKRNHTTCNWIN